MSQMDSSVDSAALVQFDKIPSTIDSVDLSKAPIMVCKNVPFPHWTYGAVGNYVRAK